MDVSWVHQQAQTRAKDWLLAQKSSDTDQFPSTLFRTTFLLEDCCSCHGVTLRTDVLTHVDNEVSIQAQCSFSQQSEQSLRERAMFLSVCWGLYHRNILSVKIASELKWLLVNSSTLGATILPKSSPVPSLFIKISSKLLLPLKVKCTAVQCLFLLWYCSYSKRPRY